MTAHVLSIVGAVLIPFFAAAPAPSSPAAPDLSGEWILTTRVFGNPLGSRLELSASAGKLTGAVWNGGRKPVDGTVEGERVRFSWKDEDGTTNTYEGRFRNGALAGTATFSGESYGATPPSPWTARRPATDRPPSPRTLDFEPTEFHRVFSASIEPVLRIWPGDIVRTKTVDAGGVDEKGKSRGLGGNPQTGTVLRRGGDARATRSWSTSGSCGSTAPPRSATTGSSTARSRATTPPEHKDNNFKTSSGTSTPRRASPVRRSPRIA